MKKLLLPLLSLLGLTVPSMQAETINLQGTDYEVKTLIKRDLGPGVTYTRLRIPDYPLNVNILEMDNTNPYAKMETTQASDRLTSTEALANASKRHTKPGHKVLGGTNANFWCVSGQPPYSDFMTGITYGANIRNGKIITELNNTNDKWNGGWKHTGVAAVDRNNKITVGNLVSHSTVNSSKFDAEEVINQFNKACRPDEIALYNSYFGTDKAFQPVNPYTGSDGKLHFEKNWDEVTTVFLTIDEGSEWAGGEEITATVKAVTSASNQQLGSYDAALIGKGSKKAVLDRLAEGDKVTFKYDLYTKVNGGGKAIKVENAVAGNALVLNNGEYTTYNDSETYNSQIYSRTGIGANAEGTKTVLIVIDKSADPLYGSSAGCNTKVMCDILKTYGCVNVVNMDAGGSAEMLVDGKIINRTTEINPRAVANGFLMVSTAPEDNTVARLEFDTYELIAPIYSSLQPKVIAYNKYGDVLDFDLKGFTLSCDPEVGTCDGESFTAGGKETKGLLTATYNGVSVSKEITILQAAMSIRLKPILIDATRHYPMEVTATIRDQIYTYNPASITWTVEDPSIATVSADGILSGLKNGTTKVTATIGDFSDVTEVNVEIAPEERMSVPDYSAWTASGTSGITGVTISPEGIIGFTYGAPRSPYMKVAGAYTFFSLPDKIELTFTPSVDIEKIIPDFGLGYSASKDGKTITPTTAYAAGNTHTVEIEFDADLNDLISFPIAVKGFTFYPTKSTAWKGEQNIKINDLCAIYKNTGAGVENIVSDSASDIRITPATVTAGQVISVTSSTEIRGIEIFNISGAMISSVKAASNVVSVAAPVSSGLYIVRATTVSGVKAAKILVR